MKPYLYGGLALLIVGLFSVVFIQHSQLKLVSLELSVATEQNKTLSLQVGDLRESVARKEGAMLAYNQIDTAINGLVQTATKVILGYKKRDTENEKCLDLTPPTDLLELLKADSLRRQGSVLQP